MLKTPKMSSASSIPHWIVWVMWKGILRPFEVVELFLNGGLEWTSTGISTMAETLLSV